MAKVDTKNRLARLAIRYRTSKLPIVTAALLSLMPFLICLPAVADSSTVTPPRLLHIMSDHLSWGWNADQLRGFKQGLSLPGAEFKVFELDIKRNSR